MTIYPGYDGRAFRWLEGKPGKSGKMRCRTIRWKIMEDSNVAAAALRDAGAKIDTVGPKYKQTWVMTWPANGQG